MNARFVLAIAISIFAAAATAQPCTWGWSIAKKSEIAFGFPNQAMTTARHSFQPYLYVAAKERGLLVYDITTATPVIKDSIPVSALNNMEVMNLHQDGDHIYLALGNHFNINSVAGMAIVDIINPAQLILKDTWVNTVPSGGAGIIKTSGDYAYLGAMREGLIVLDISDKNNIIFKSQLIPSTAYPNPTNPDPNKYNARGMEVRNDKVYLCYDAGGLRIIDVADKTNPTEIGKYSNPLLINRPRAYNNIVVDQKLAYITVDYCGMEVLDISDPANITQTGWWNPWQCQDPTVNNWFNSPGHTNEIRYFRPCQLLFMSSGKNELQIVSVGQPSSPKLCDSFGNGINTEGTWGVNISDNEIYLSYIFVPLGIPFYSNWSGVKILNWTANCGDAVGTVKYEDFKLYPNPAADEIIIEDKRAIPASITLYNAIGSRMSVDIEKRNEQLRIDITPLSPGIYQIRHRDRSYRFIKQ